MKRLAGWKSWLLTLAAALLPLDVPASPTGEQPAGVIASGTPSATPYYVRDSGVTGPTVVITGGVHGNEPAGAYAADQIRHWPITRGKLIIVPRANVVALKADKRNIPGEPVEVANLNRNFPKASEKESPRGALALALWEFVQRQKPAWCVDLHEGSDFNAMTGKSVGSSVIAFPTPDDKAVALAIQTAVNANITNQNHRFTLRGPPVDGSLARAAGEHLGAHAMILETTSKSQALSVRARQHRIMVHVLLNHLGMIDGSVTPELMTSRVPPITPVPRLAVYDDGGTGGVGAARIVEQVGRQPGTVVVRVCGDDIRAGALGQFNVIAVPGGSGSKEAATIGEDGRDRIRKFVENGGGYIGICAGAYLATSGFSWGLRILDAKTVSPKWDRGHAMVKLELTDQGRRILGNIQGTFDCKYANGPILCPAHVESLPDYEPLAFFRTEVAEHNAPPGIMVNSPAIVAGRCGKGRVVVSSPHPEQTKGLEEFIPRAVAWVTDRASIAEKTNAR
ncbi:MAG: succinylglutamate desuccinylase/aspartoacylase family protein [Verrucomicrobia bacterium]|nr:succinylglutamate desuccinylase/aspartoacylase family protein [Verrucomicrobiota bacterium]